MEASQVVSSQAADRLFIGVCVRVSASLLVGTEGGRLSAAGVVAAATKCRLSFSRGRSMDVAFLCILTVKPLIPNANDPEEKYSGQAQSCVGQSAKRNGADIYRSNEIVPLATAQ